MPRRWGARRAHMLAGRHARARVKRIRTLTNRANRRGKGRQPQLPKKVARKHTRPDD